MARYLFQGSYSTEGARGLRREGGTRRRNRGAARVRGVEARRRAGTVGITLLREREHAASDGGHARIRIFTPVAELPFAGHPVLGSAFVLGAPLQLGEIQLETGAGIVPVALEREGARITFGWMAQPIPQWEPYAGADELLGLLGAESQLPVELYVLGPGHVFIALRSEDEVAALAPDFGALARVAPVGVNCFAGSGKKWKTRMFAPSNGVPEDPATGSAAGPLAIHLVGRPSTLYARAFGAGDGVDRVEVGGSAVIVARGEFRL